MAEGTDASIEALNASLQSDDSLVQYQAAFELLKRGQSQGLNVIIDHLEHGDADYLDRYEVVNLLANYNDERVVDVLIGMIDPLGGHIVGNVLATLLAIGAERGIRAVIEMLKAPSPWWGWGTANHFADHGHRYVPQLLEASYHADPLMRARSIYALARIATKQTTAVIQERLIGALNDSDDVTRQQAAWGLAQLTSPSAHTALIAVLDSEDMTTAQWAADGLYKAGKHTETALNLLIRSLKHDDWLIRRNAVWALQRIGASAVVPPLIDVLSSDPMRALRHWAAEALAALGDTSAITALRTGLSDPDEMVRASCVNALSTLAGPSIAPEFAKLQFDESILVQQAVTGAWTKFNYHSESG